MDATELEARFYEARTGEILAIVFCAQNQDWFWNNSSGGPDVGPFTTLTAAVFDAIVRLTAAGTP